MIRSAHIEGEYRYSLDRTWDESKQHVLWIMLNPSTANGLEDDPTVRRCMNFSLQWGFGGLQIVNLFALRATDPNELKLERSSDPVGPDNDGWILNAIERAPGLVVAAWGAKGGLFDRDRIVLPMLNPIRVDAPCLGTTKDKFPITPLVDIRCLGVTRDNFPKHPLYVAAATDLIHYRGRDSSYLPA